MSRVGQKAGAQVPAQLSPWGLTLLHEVRGWTWNETLRIAFLFVLVLGTVTCAVRFALQGLDPTWATTIAGLAGVGGGGAAVALRRRRR